MVKESKLPFCFCAQGSSSRRRLACERAAFVHCASLCIALPATHASVHHLRAIQRCRPLKERERKTKQSRRLWEQKCPEIIQTWSSRCVSPTIFSPSPHHVARGMRQLCSIAVQPRVPLLLALLLAASMMARRSSGVTGPRSSSPAVALQVSLDRHDSCCCHRGIVDAGLPLGRPTVVPDACCPSHAS